MFAGVKSSTQFLSTPSARRATAKNSTASSSDVISIHALREEGDKFAHEPLSQRLKFLSTPSARRATREPDELPGGFFISIHALREEGDDLIHVETESEDISIHALREEGDGSWRARALQRSKFLSTPSARRATFWAAA